MNASLILGGSIVLLVIAYYTWGSFVARRLNVNPKNPVPSHEQRDGIDYEPARAPVVLGHHFASIAGAGPIVGPIIAVAFGWLPALLWILVGSVFLGAVHDFSSLVASLRHQGRSVGELIEEYVGRRGKTLFLIFALATLILVIAVFTDAVIQTFIAQPEVASSSGFFIVAAVSFGLLTRYARLSLTLATLVGIVLLVGGIVLGFVFPVALADITVFGLVLTPTMQWVAMILVYITLASVSPVWVLLQPRDYLNSFMLYAMMLAAIAGIFIAQPTVQSQAFVGFEVEGVGRLFPLLFVTVACGAISGFHSLVASGTTSKQLDSEADAKFVGYGAMLIEAALAVIALLSVATLTQPEMMAARTNPIQAFGSGVGNMMTSFGLPYEYGAPFIALTVSAFAMTTLDTCTRLARFLLQELFESDAPTQHPAARVIATNRWVATLLVAATGGLFVFSGTSGELWPVFGSANQLLAALALLAVATWLSKKNVKKSFIVIPMFIMYAVTVVALIDLVVNNVRGIAGAPNYLLAGVSLALLLLSLELLRQAMRVLKPVPGAPPAADSL